MSTLQTLVDNITETTNGMKAYKSTTDSLLDLFYSGYSYRNDIEKLQNVIDKASDENPEIALKILFYLRKFRNNGGCGERLVFREGLKYFITKYVDDFKNQENLKVIEKIPDFGRWDDMFSIIGISSEVDTFVFDIIKNQLIKDIKEMKKGNPISLLAKWMPSINTSSKNAVNLAYKLAKVLEMKPSSYRKILSKLRNHLKIVEHNLMNKDYKSIDYPSVPANAMAKYRKAFSRNDEERFTEYLNSVNQGTSKLNAGNLFPHELVAKAMSTSDETEKQYLDMAWKSLPNYFNSASANKPWLAVVDVSGSMYSKVGKSPKPIFCSVGIGMYIAEHNEGIFKDEIITFSERPSFVKLKGDTFTERVSNLVEADWGWNTNLMNVYKLILETALENNLHDSEMPGYIVIISDMQFDHAVDSGGRNSTAFKAIKNMYKKSGYTAPKLIFWNVACNTFNMPVTKNDTDVVMIGGYRPGLYDMILKANTPLDFMNTVILDSLDFECITFTHSSKKVRKNNR